MSKVFDAYAAYYDLLYKDKDYEAEVEYVRLLMANQGVTCGSILELGCGTGKHAELFALMGFSVHGIDMSQAMVKEANKRKSADLADLLHFETGDVRDYRVDRKFDVVVSLFHVASYQTTNEDLSRMFDTASRHLKPGGIFIFDFWYGPGVISDKPAVRVKRMENKNLLVTRIAEPEMVCSENIVNVNYSISVENKENNKVRKISEKHSMRYLFQPEIDSFCTSNSISLLLIYSWMQEKKVTCNDWLGVAVTKRH